MNTSALRRFCIPGLFLAIGLSLLIGTRSSMAQETLHINIYGPGQSKLNIYLGPPKKLRLSGDPSKGEPFRKLKDVVSHDLAYLPFFKQIPGEDILGGPALEGVKAGQIDFKRFRMSQVDVLITLGWKPREEGLGQAELRAYDVYSGELILGRGYVLAEKGQIAEAANRFCGDLMEEITGRSGFFRSELAFARKKNKSKQICMSAPQGHNFRQITELNGVCMSPAWSWDGQHLAFTHVTDQKHELLIWNRDKDQLKHAFLPGNTIISPTFRPDGTLAVSADPQGNPDIYFLGSDWSLGEPVVQNWAIDISPQFDAQGDKMVFVSSRLGNPHIFLRDFEKGKVKRISFEGTYNTNPSISPDGRFVAYSRLTDNGHRIIVHDLKNGEERQVTQGPGNDEDPAWGPDSYFLAFSSDRTGEYKIFVTTRHGDEPMRIPTGEGVFTSPAWNPKVPK